MTRTTHYALRTTHYAAIGGLLLLCLACGDTTAAGTATPIGGAGQTTATASPLQIPSPVPATPTTPTSPLPAAPTATLPAAPTSPLPAAPTATLPAAPTATLPPAPAAPPGPPVLTNTKAVYGSTGAPYAVIYPANWTVSGATAANTAFPDLPEFVQIAYPAGNFGIQVNSGPTRPDLPPKTLLAAFLAYQQTLAPLTVTAQTGSAGGAVKSAVGATFTTQTDKGPLTGQVDVYQNPATSYLVVTFFDTAYFGKDPPVENAATAFYLLAPATAYPTAPPGAAAPIRLAGLGSISCPKGWAGTTDTAAHQLNCNNQVRGSQGNADITVTLTNTVAASAAAAAHATSLAGVPFAQLRLAPDLFAFVIQSGLVGTRLEYVRTVPAGGAPAGTALIVANGEPDEVIPAIRSFRAAAPPAPQTSAWVQAALPTTETRVLASDPHVGGALYLGGAGLYRSTDAGQTWTTLTTAWDVNTLTVAPGNPHVLYAGLGNNCYGGGGPGALHRSTDGGATWQDLHGGPAHIVVSPGDENDLLGLQCDGVYGSKDGGQTWTPRHAASDKHYGFFAFAVARDDSQALYALTGGETENTNLLGSTDGGQTWAPLPNPPSLPGCTTVVAPGAARQVFCAANGGFFASANGGHTWKLQVAGTHTQGQGLGADFFLAAPPPDPAVTPGAVPPTLYLSIAHPPAGGPGTLFAGNGTDQWQAVATAPANRAIRDLALAHTANGAVLVAVLDTGVYRLPLP